MKLNHTKINANSNFSLLAISKKKDQKGFTLIEVSVGLLIAAIVAAAAFVAFQNNSRRQEVRENVAEITVQIVEAKQKFGRTVAFDNLTTGLAEQSGTIDRFNSYGGSVCLSGAAAGTLGDSSFDACTTSTADGGPNDVAVLQWDRVPVDQCLDLVTATIEGARSMYVGTTAVRTDDENDLSQVEVACAPEGADFVKMSWVIPQR